jgi:hypothetical protein
MWLWRLVFWLFTAVAVGATLAAILQPFEVRAQTPELRPPGHVWKEPGTGNWVRIDSRPCKNPEVLALIAPEGHVLWSHADAKLENVPWAACWRAMGGTVFVLYPDGDLGVIRESRFRPEQVI